MRFDDRLILGLLTSHGRDCALPQSHAAILLAGQPVKALA
jgi:flagellar transcriptional activator FlhD